ncbi:hypothetical protein, partial [Persephonella sp.]
MRLILLVMFVIFLNEAKAEDNKKDCVEIEICGCKDKKCMIFPTTCLPEGWKYQDYKKCEGKEDKIKIPMH